MMAPNKPPTTLAVNKKRTEISLEGIREKGGAEVCLGLKAEAGGLFSAGICPLADIDAGFTLPEGCRAAAWWQTDGLSAVYAEDGYLYVRRSGTFEKTAAHFDETPACVRAIAEKAVMLFSDGEKTVSLTEEGAEETDAVPPFSCAAFCNDRLWVLTGEADGNRLRYSAPLDIFDFEEREGEGGHLDLPDAKGKISAMLVRNGEIAIVREYGLQMLSAPGDPEKFFLQDLPSFFGRIYAGTACAENGKLYFLTDRGACVYDGETQSFYPEFSRFLADEPQTGASAAACGGEVVFTFLVRTGGEVRPAVGVFREDGGGGCLLPADAHAAAVVRTERGPRAAFLSDGRIFCVAEKGEVVSEGFGYWQSGVFSPFAGGECLLEEMCVRAEGSVSLSVSSEFGSRRLCACGTGRMKRIRPALRGSAFVFVFETEGRAAVFSLSASFSKLKQGG